MANTIGGEKKQVGATAAPTKQHEETKRTAGRFADHEQASVGTPGGPGRIPAARKAVHGQNAEPGQANNDGQSARKGNTPHHQPELGGYPHRSPVPKQKGVSLKAED